jgi:hypothetical protein
MEDKQPRERETQPLALHASDHVPVERVDELSRRREQHRRALTEGERTERWPCG